MMTSCCAILGLVFLVITNLAIIISFATPYWLEISPILQAHRHTRGLWAYCDESECTWVFQDSYSTHDQSIWWVATQALMSFGLALGLLALLLATLALCCECKGCNSSHAVAGLLMIAFLVMAVGVVIFGINAHNDPNFSAELDWKNNPKSIFSWSYWLGIASAGWALFTSIVYGCEGRRHRV